MKPFHDLTSVGQARRLRPHAINLLEDAFGIRAARLRQLTSASNTIFRVERHKQPPLVLRIASPKSCHGLEETRSELAWLETLCRNGHIDVPQAIHTLAGDPVPAIAAPGIPGTRHAALFRWIPGKMLADCLTVVNVAAHGRLAAALHERAQGFSPPSWFRIRSYRSAFPYSNPSFVPSEPIVLFDHLAKGLMPPERKAVFRRVLDRVQRAIDDLHHDTAPQVIHNDLHVWNVKISRGAPYALDFEDLLWGFPLQDLATTLYYYRYRDDYGDLLAAFRGGYETVRPWPVVDTRGLETLIAGRALLLANYVAASEDAEDRAFAPEYLHRAETRFRSFLKEVG